MSSTDTTGSVSNAVETKSVNLKYIFIVDELSDPKYIFVTISFRNDFKTPDPLAGRFVNPLEVAHVINESLSNGVSDLVYIVAQASISKVSLFINFNTCM